jgi:two-component system sensor histidine kinase FlrB
MRAEPVTLGVEAAPSTLGTLAEAFETFTAATARLEREYAALRRRAAQLTAELEEKNRRLAASLERERVLEATALRQSRLAAMGEMAAMLAHEVRNPLGAMELCTGLLLQDLHGQPEAQRLTRQVAAGIADLNHLVTNLLEFTRTRRAAAEGRVDCRLVVDDALRYAADLIAANGVIVARELAPGDVTARGDAALLRPALLNLVRNAVQAMPTGGTLTVAVARCGDGIALAVGDTGPGVAEELRDSIFAPFYTTRARGTGLGLTVVRELVTALGGTVTLASVAGVGATFTIRLHAAS